MQTLEHQRVPPNWTFPNDGLDTQSERNSHSHARLMRAKKNRDTTKALLILALVTQSRNIVDFECLLEILHVGLLKQAVYMVYIQRYGFYMKKCTTFKLNLCIW